MDISMKQTFAAIGMAFLLASCSDNKPFAKLASVYEESFAAYRELDAEYEKDPNKGGYGDRSRELSLLYDDKETQAMQELEGTEIETEVIDAPGLTVKKAFTATVNNKYGTSLELVATINVDETFDTSMLGTIGYSGSKPLYYFSSNNWTVGDDIEITIKLSEEFSYSANIEFIKNINKIVLTTDKELIERMQKEDRTRHGYND